LIPNEGEVWLNDRERASLPAPAWRKLVTYVGAESGWWADMVIEHFPAAARSVVASLADRLGLRTDVLSASVHQLSTVMVREAIRRGLLPIINQMSAAGIVTLPGIMTGQILAGLDPLEAVKY